MGAGVGGGGLELIGQEVLNVSGMDAGKVVLIREVPSNLLSMSPATYSIHPCLIYSYAVFRLESDIIIHVPHDEVEV